MPSSYHSSVGYKQMIILMVITGVICGLSPNQIHHYCFYGYYQMSAFCYNRLKFGDSTYEDAPDCSLRSFLKIMFYCKLYWKLKIILL